MDARVLILMGSDSDWPALEKGASLLGRLGIPHQVEVSSAHRSPARTVRLVREATEAGVQVFIAAAGGAAHLAGVVAAHTTRPVIGVPVPSGSLQGLDSLLSTVQMPPGVPVATVAVGGAENAAWLAAQVLALADPRLAEELLRQRAELERSVESKSEALKARLSG